MATKLTDLKIQKSKPAPTGKRYTLWDAVEPGLGLRVTDKGHKSFVVYRRVAGAAQPVRRTLGDYPSLSLADARELAHAFKKDMGAGIDPKIRQERERQENARLQASTFTAVADQFIERYAKKEQRRWQETKRILDVYLIPKWGKWPITEIRRVDIRARLHEIEDEHGHVMADRAFAALRKLFNWHAAGDDAFTNPITRGMREVRTTKRERVLTHDEIRAIWPLLDRPEFQPAFGPAIKALFLTAQRKNEVAGMLRSELASDRERGKLWIIPKDRYKSEIDQVVPVTPEVNAVIEAQPKWSGRCDYVFTTDGRAHFQGFQKKKAKLDELSGVTDWTIHDIRRTAKTLMIEAGVGEFVADRVLGHVIPGVAGTYNRYSYVKEKRAALETLARAIDGIVNRRPANVVPLRSAPAG